ncbi:uncharacterized protein LOC135057998 [Pseudophryne corroboree]|uniref:uncharacterized protein LOC135057998 n=1 Tax=Pseudophryne corroboree TaxID=495146 RepID=UPI0030812B0C
MNRSNTEPEPMETEPSNDNLTITDNANLDATKERKKKIVKNKEEQRENMTTSGLLFIKAFQILLQKTKAPKESTMEYMQRVLHAIFFLGHINDPPISPKEFIPTTILAKFQEVFPKPFQEYNTQLPSQTPYSILLEYMTASMEVENPDLFMLELVSVNESLWKIYDDEGNQPVANDFAFKASVITYSCVKDQNERVLNMAYGASMSCKGRTQRRIMIAISALYVWDKAISYAVCCGDKGPAIKFPDHVHCTAYRFDTRKREYKEIPPCTICNKMYVSNFRPMYQVTNKKETWPFGNCAENESFSKLLHCSTDVREAIHTVSDEGGRLMNRKDIENTFKDEYEDKMKNNVRNLLASRKFSLTSGDWQFFTPVV